MGRALQLVPVTRLQERGRRDNIVMERSHSGKEEVRHDFWDTTLRFGSVAIKNNDSMPLDGSSTACAIEVTNENRYLRGTVGPTVQF